MAEKFHTVRKPEEKKETPKVNREKLKKSIEKKKSQTEEQTIIRK